MALLNESIVHAAAVADSPSIAGAAGGSSGWSFDF